LQRHARPVLKLKTVAQREHDAVVGGGDGEGELGHAAVPVVELCKQG